MSNKKVTIAEIAEHLGVSKASVSRALNGVPGVGEDLRERVFQYAEEVGYQLPTPKKDPSSSGSVIGLIVGDIRNPFYVELLFQIQRVLAENNYSIMLFNSEYDIDREKHYLQLAREYDLAGLILFTVPSDLPQEAFDGLDIPIVFVNRAMQIQNFDSVLLDNFRAGYIAAMHLIELGHKDIGFVSGPETSLSSMQRLEGFKQALTNYFLVPNEDYIWSGNLRLENGYAMAEEIFSHPSRPTALVVGNDLMALGVLDYCNEHDIAVPDTVSLVAFDNIPYGSIHGIDLTTVDHNTAEMGRQTAELMLLRLKDPAAPVQRIIQEPRLIVRKTTGGPRS